MNTRARIIITSALETNTLCVMHRARQAGRPHYYILLSVDELLLQSLAIPPRNVHYNIILCVRRGVFCYWCCASCCCIIDSADLALAERARESALQHPRGEGFGRLDPLLAKQERPRAASLWRFLDPNFLQNDLLLLGFLHHRFMWDN